MILITFILDILLQLYQFFILPYIGGGIETINEINDNWNFIVVGSIQSKAELIVLFIYHVVPYLIILFCAIKMIKYVNAHIGYDNKMKKMLKQLTLTLILLVHIRGGARLVSRVSYLVFFRGHVSRIS
uniref:Uncharacterized protein n=1 Tax=Meloidogyne enterolobii TaxID=390850 RepID=A0A6V7WSM1_MELEN|nr:unnamed protein product [Meloidogyne enterolobii]